MIGGTLIYNENIALDNIQMLTFINDFTKSLGVDNVELDDEVLYYSVLQQMRQDFPYVYGIDKANVFKKVAYFMCYFIGEQPIKGAFPEDSVGSLVNVSNHQNAMVALQVAIESLHGATVKMGDNGECLLENRIRLSKHSYLDIIHAIHDATVNHQYKTITVLLEQLAYKENPKCQFELLDF